MNFIPSFSEAIDVGRTIAHQPFAVAAQVRDADVVTPDDDNIWFFICHGLVLLCLDNVLRIKLGQFNDIAQVGWNLEIEGLNQNANKTHEAN